MFKESSITRTNASRLDIFILLTSFFAVAIICAYQGNPEPPQTCDRQLQAEVDHNVSPLSPPIRKASLERDPWANPILSCSLVAPEEFGYDRRHIYRLPSEPKGERPRSDDGLRDPMANLLLQEEEGRG